MDKDDGAFLTIGELARELGVAQHILRYWETRFPQLRPLQRAGNRRYYRPRDVEIARYINSLLNEEGFTVRGAQRLLAGQKSVRQAETAPATPQDSAIVPAGDTSPSPTETQPLSALASKDEKPSGTAAAAPVPTTGQDVRHSGQIGPSDLAVLIARLTVIRQNLQEAIGED